MPILVRKAKMRLTYREEKPEVHVVRRLTYPIYRLVECRWGCELYAVRLARVTP